MSTGAPNFAAYLLCNLPYGYPFDPFLTPQNLPQLKERHRKLITTQQSAFHETALRLLPTHPWLSYLAALKDEALLTFIPIDTTPFVNVQDQKVFNTVHEGWRLLRQAARAAVEDGIAFFCERLIQLQREAPLIDEVESALRTARNSGIRALLPLSVKPPKDSDEEVIRLWRRQDSYVHLVERPFNRITALSPDMRHNGLKDLDACLAALAGLREERELLVANYITPYLA